MKRFFALLTILVFTTLAPAQAAMTGWTEVQGGAVRLIAGGTLKDGHYLAGLEFLLEPGWHTYWRYPGEAGIPPQIGITASENVKETEVLYPVPERYSDGFSESIVYHDGVVLPIRITPEDPVKAVTLSVELFFGICKDICVPGDAVLSLTLDPEGDEDSLAERLIARDLDNVPLAQHDAELHVRNVSLSEDGTRLVIASRVSGQEDIDLFAAGPEGSYIAQPKIQEREGDEAIWHLPVKGLAASDSDTTLRLVLIAGGKAVEHLEQIDPAWLKP